MMGPDEADFQDRLTDWFSIWRPDLMEKVSMADLGEIWEKVEALCVEAEDREPIKR